QSDLYRGRRRGTGRSRGLPVDPRAALRHPSCAAGPGVGCRLQRRARRLRRREAAGALRPARNRPSRRGAVHRPARPRRPKGSDARDPRIRLVRGRNHRAREQRRRTGGRTVRAGQLMRLVFAGTPEPAVPSLRRLIASTRHEVVAVVTRPDAVAGRGRKVTRSPIGALADEHGIPVLTPAKPSDPQFLATLTDLAPDCCPVVAYGALLPQRALDIPRHGWVNLHFSLLPAWRGAAPVQAAINAGDEITGASTFLIEKGLDSGPVYGVITERIDAADTAGELLGR